MVASLLGGRITGRLPLAPAGYPTGPTRLDCPDALTVARTLPERRCSIRIADYYRTGSVQVRRSQAPESLDATGDRPAAPTRTARNPIPSQTLLEWSRRRLHGCCAAIHHQSARPHGRPATHSGGPERLTTRTGRGLRVCSFMCNLILDGLIQNRHGRHLGGNRWPQCKRNRLQAK